MSDGTSRKRQSANRCLMMDCLIDSDAKLRKNAVTSIRTMSFFSNYLRKCLRFWPKEKAMPRAPPLLINLYNNTLFGYSLGAAISQWPQANTYISLFLYRKNNRVSPTKLLFLTIPSFLEKRRPTEKAGLLTSLRSSSTFSPGIPAMVFAWGIMELTAAGQWETFTPFPF